MDELLKLAKTAARAILGPYGPIADAAFGLVEDYIRAGKDPVTEIQAIRDILPAVAAVDAEIDAKLR